VTAETIINICYSVVFALLLLAVWRVSRNRWKAIEQDIDEAIADATRDRVGLTEHDVDPDSLRFLEDLEAHLKAYGATVADFYTTTEGDR
jgi:hypothetical protein